MGCDMVGCTACTIPACCGPALASEMLGEKGVHPGEGDIFYLPQPFFFLILLL